MRWGQQIACGIVWTVGAAVQADEFSAAAGYYATQQWRQAHVAFDRLVQYSPHHPRRAEAEFFSAESTAQLGDFATAGKRFAAFLENHPAHPLTVRASFRVGEARYLAGERQQAIPYLQHFVQQHPHHELNEYALAYLGLALAETTDVNAARRALVASIDRFPRGRLARPVIERLLELDYQQLDASGLRATLDRFAQLDPATKEEADWHFWLARLYQLKRQTREALAEYDRALAADTAGRIQERAIYEAARLQLELGDTSATLARLTALCELGTQSERAEWGYGQRIRILAEQQRWGEAMSLAEEFRQRFPQSKYLRGVQRLLTELHSPADGGQRALIGLDDLADDGIRSGDASSDVERAVARYQLARSHYEAGDYQAAISLLEPIDTTQLPANVAGRIEYARASSHQQLRQFDQGIEALDRAAARPGGASFDARVRWKRITLRTQAARWDEALSDLKQWEPNGDDAIWYYRQAGRQLAEAAFAAGQYEHACTAFALLVAHLTGPPDMAHGLAGMAWCYLRQQKWATAAELFQRLSDQFPTSAQVPSALFARAYSLESMNDLQEAARAYAQIIERHPQDAQRWLADLKLAELLQRLEQTDAAAGVLEAGLRAAAAGGVRDRLRYQLAMIRDDLGQVDASRELLHELHAAGPGGEFWADATYRLSQAALDNGDLAGAERLVDELVAARADERALRLAPYGIYLKARIAAQRGEWAEVLVHLDNLQIAYPDSSLTTAARVWSIEALHRLGDYENVRHRIRSLVESQVPLRPVWRRLIDLRDAQALAESGQAKEAADRVRSLANGALHDRFWAEAMVLIGRCEVQQRRYAQAHLSFRKVLDERIELDRETHNACWSLIGDVHLAQGDYQQALDAYLHVRPHRDSFWYASAVMGVVESLDKLGRNEEARVVLRRLADSHLNSLDRSRTRELMEQLGDAVDGASEPQIPVSTTSSE